LRAWTGGNA